MADTQAYRSGKITGTNKSASMTSLPRVAAVMVESMRADTRDTDAAHDAAAPRAASPLSAGAAKLVRKNTQYSGTAITSTTSQEHQVRRRLRQEHHRLGPAGLTSRPSKQPVLRLACANERFRPRSDVNTTSAHRRPPHTCRHVGSRAGEVCASAAPNTTITRKRVDAHGHEHLLRAELLPPSPSRSSVLYCVQVLGALQQEPLIPPRSAARYPIRVPSTLTPIADRRCGTASANSSGLELRPSRRSATTRAA